MPDSVPFLAMSETSTRDNHTGSWKYLRPVYHDRVAPCNERCPVGIDIEGWISLLGEGRIDEAVDVLLRENPMPAVTGRVCHHPCELACNRREFDEAVSIHAIERAVGDRALMALRSHDRSGRDRPAEDAPVPDAASMAGRIAIIGSGPAGLSCAWHLARLGYGVTVFDDAIEPGGMLRQGIPEYRLPRAVLDAEIDRIRRSGVEFRCGVSVGLDIAWPELYEYDAIFLATGAHRSATLGVQGEEHPEVRSGLTFLKEVNQRRHPVMGERVAVIGGGNTAIDCARTALRLGARPLVVYRRTRAEMPAIADEVADAEREGIDFEFLASPSRFVIEDGRLRGIECVRMTPGTADESGRRRPVPLPDSAFGIAVDTVLTATGERIDEAALPVGVAANGRVPTGALGDVILPGEGHGAAGADVRDPRASRRPLFFAGGDLAGDERTVAHALGAGKRAAIGIDRALAARAGRDRANPDRSGDAASVAATSRSAVRDGVEADSAGDVSRFRFGPRGNLSMTRWRDDDPVRRISPINEVASWEHINARHFRHRPRHPDGHDASVATDFAEVNTGIAWDIAVEEARRCFNCGACNQCELCLIFCADVAISRNAGGYGFDIDLEYCKGCGICAEECPRGAIAMTREGL